MRRLLPIVVVLIFVVPLLTISRPAAGATILEYGMYTTDPGSTMVKPPGSSTKFTQDDVAAWLWFTIAIQMNTNTTIYWIRPDGATYLFRTYSLDKFQSASYNYRGSLEIKGKDAAKYPGQWTVQVKAYDQIYGETELLKLSFTIEPVILDEKDYTWTVNEKHEIHIEQIVTNHPRGQSWTQAGQNGGPITITLSGTAQITNFKVYDYDTKQPLEPVYSKDGTKYTLGVMLKTPQTSDFKILFVYDMIGYIQNTAKDEYRVSWGLGTGVNPIPSRYTIILPAGYVIKDVGAANYTQRTENGKVVVSFSGVSPPYGAFSWWLTYRSVSATVATSTATSVATSPSSGTMGIGVLMGIVGVALVAVFVLKRQKSKPAQPLASQKTPAT